MLSGPDNLYMSDILVSKLCQNNKKFFKMVGGKGMWWLKQKVFNHKSSVFNKKAFQ